MYRTAFVGFCHDGFCFLFFLDITRRYLSLLAHTTRDFAERSNRPEPVLSDVRAAMEHIGLIHPVEVFTPPPPYRHSHHHHHHLPKRRKLETSSAAGNSLLGGATPAAATHGLPDAFELINNPITSLSLNHSLTMIDPTEILLSSGMDSGAWGSERQILEGVEGEEGQGDDGDYDENEGEDTRGVDALIAWFKGPVAAEMRRVAGVTTGSSVEGADSGNNTSTMPAPAVIVAIANGSRTAPVNVGGGTAPHTTGGERETNPITWLDGTVPS